jgi:hypothetical protein
MASVGSIYETYSSEKWAFPLRGENTPEMKAPSTSKGGQVHTQFTMPDVLPADDMIDQIGAAFQSELRLANS